MDIKSPSSKPVSKKWISRKVFWILFFVCTLTCGGGAYFLMIFMPGKSFSGELPPLSLDETKISKELKDHVVALADKIGERNIGYYPKKLTEALVYLEGEFKKQGYTSRRLGFKVGNEDAYNLEVELSGNEKKNEILILGAHYDSAPGTPGANDNGSAVASLLVLSRMLAGSKNAKTIRFVAFVNEEPPYFQGELMGSLVYAKQCKSQKDNITGMISLETMGYFSDKEGSQKYPASVLGWVYPTRGNFIGFVGNIKSRKFVTQTVKLFRNNVKFPSEATCLPEVIQGIGWSDHWSFWQVGYPALMVTDTAPFRYPYYHTSQDTPDKIDYDRLARVVSGLKTVVEELAK